MRFERTQRGDGHSSPCSVTLGRLVAILAAMSDGEINISGATVEDIPVIKQLLVANDLPTDGIDDQLLRGFHVADADRSQVLHFLLQQCRGTVREVAYLGSVTRYAVELDRGQTLIVLRQNLDTSAAQALAQQGRRVRLAWRAEDASVLDTNHEEDDT